MEVGEFTASNIAMEEDMKEDRKRATIDIVKMAADVAAQKALASTVRFDRLSGNIHYDNGRANKNPLTH
jgi:hypothetical protein